MSVLIRGMEMPYGCANCPFVSGPVYESYGIANYFCKVDVEGARGNNVTTEVIALYEGATEAFPRFCPLVEVPPHGRLIDADAFDERVRVAGGMSEEELTEDFKDGVQTVLYMLSKQPTIIEAEGIEE